MSSSSFSQPLFLSFSKVFWKAVSTKDVINPVTPFFILSTIYLSYLTLRITSCFTSSDQLIFPSFSSTKIHYFQGIYHQLSEVSMFLRLTKFMLQMYNFVSVFPTLTSRCEVQCLNAVCLLLCRHHILKKFF